MLITALYFVSGLCIGYFSGSYVESFMHQYVSDAPSRFYRFYKRYPRLFSGLTSSYYTHHIIHHYHTFKTAHTRQFASEEEEKKLQQKLVKRGIHGRLIINSGYGVGLGATGVIKYMIVLALPLPLFYVLFNDIIFLGICISAWLPIPMSRWLHYYIHIPRAEVQKSSSFWLKWLMNTRYMRQVAVNHFIHHKYGGKSNFNLVLGADVIRGVSRKATLGDYRDMKKAGLI